MADPEPPECRQAKGQNMSGAQLNDVGHENALTPGDIVAATAIAQFYNFASRCMDWAKTTRSLQERAVYAQMGLQWLAAGARLQTFLQFESSQDVSRKAATDKTALKAAAFDIELAGHQRQIQSGPLSQDRAYNNGGLHDATEE
jgi:hypothetical protein